VNAATTAPGKINVCLFLGPLRPDGRHELVSVMQPVTLADEVRLEPGSGPQDDVVCDGVVGDNLAGAAAAAFRRRTGWSGPPVRIVIDKRIPVAAGMAGGSADAGAVLRLLAEVSGMGDDLLQELAVELGADVAAQVRPGRVLATGVGEVLEPLDDPSPYGVLVLPSTAALSTGDVFREADRQGLARDAGDLADRLAAVRAGLPDVPSALAVNDLEMAARALCPAIEDALGEALEAGAEHVMVSGSGPTVLGLFGDPAAAQEAAAALADRTPSAVAAVPAAAREAVVR
jgi:4-diphosphocytidyl-2-C-methyl-D-erythritol kinase